jgi:hypothetical protein
MKEGRRALSPIIRTCVQIVESTHANHALVSAAGHLISAEALFDEWFSAKKSQTKPGTFGEARLLELFRAHEGLSRSLDRSFAEFSRDPRNHEEPLIAALRVNRENLLDMARAAVNL